MSLAKDVLNAARAKGIMIATAESCTGGMIASALTDIAGSSAVIDRGFVTYSNMAKIEMLGVGADTLQAHGAVSPETAQEMARGALAHSAAALAVSVTGIAGPGGSDHKPEGRVCFGVAQGDAVSVETVEFGALGRGQVRQAACDHAMTLLLRALS
ncbi:MAG: CinA family protein [Roseobacter sp.]